MIRVGTLLLAVVAAGCAQQPPTITCVGDSTTAGLTRSAIGSSPAAWDPLGGWPGRLARRLDGRARVLNRGLGGSTTSLWLTAPDGTWRGMGVQQFLRAAGWDGFVPPSGTSTLLLGVVRADRPDVVLVLLGVNDLSFEVAEHGPAAIPDSVARLGTLREQALSVARVAVVGTVPPDRHHPAGLTESLNAGIRTAFPDYLPVAERFVAAGGTALLGDEVHPSEAGYEVIAEAVAQELETRQIVPAAAP